MYPNKASQFLSGIVQFNDGGYVESVKLAKNGGTYDYVLNVRARGPKGAFSGNGYLYFTDATGGRYTLKIFDSDLKEHTLKYNSDKPAIIKFEWYN